MPLEAVFKDIEDTIIKRFLEIDPVMGTQLGLTGEHDGMLPHAENGIRESQFAELRKRVEEFAVEPIDSWSMNDRLDLELAVGSTRTLEILNSALRPHERNPDWYLDSALGSVHSLLMRSDMKADEKIVRIRQRLALIPKHLKVGQLQIQRPAAVLVETAAGNIPGAIQFCRESLSDFIRSVPSSTARIELQGYRQHCIDALSDFGDFVSSQINESTADFAIGKEAFNQLLAGSLVPHNADALFQLGQSVARDLESELEAISLRVNNQPQWWVTLEELAHYHPARASLFDEYKKMVEDSRRFLEERKLVDLTPSGALDVLPTPSFARANLPFAAYIPAPPFVVDGRAQFWVTPIAAELSASQAEDALKQQHIGRILIASVHEAYPGHHVQFSHALKARRPLRHLFSSTIFVEGWGLYSEELMLKEGFMSDDPNFDLLRMSQIRDQLWRALRIVLDVGLHCKGMSQAEATELLVERHVLDRHSAASEVMYYCSAPTQPMSYMTGKLLVDELIAKCSASGEKRFDSLPVIHNELLAHGSLPVPLLQRALRLTENNRQP